MLNILIPLLFTILFTINYFTMVIPPVYKRPLNMCHTNQSQIINTQRMNIVSEHPIIFLYLSWIIILFGFIQIFLELFWTKWPKPIEMNYVKFFFADGLDVLVLNNPENNLQEFRTNKSEDGSQEIVTNNTEIGLHERVTNDQENGLQNMATEQQENHLFNKKTDVVLLSRKPLDRF